MKISISIFYKKYFFASLSPVLSGMVMSVISKSKSSGLILNAMNASSLFEYSVP